MLTTELLRRARFIALGFCAAAGFVVLGGCGDDTLVKGTVTRETTATTFNDEITLSADAHAKISLRRYQGEDAEAPLVTEIDVPFTGFPFEYEVTGDPDAAFGAGDTLLLNIDVYNHAGDDMAVGDFSSEHTVEVDEAGAEVDVQVGGLESCSAPNAGGYCI
ncbi:MAG: hypothetical protein U0271_25315 [Polyangiaceae bacterium]